MKTEIKIGDLVTVGGCFEMGERQGQGRIVADNYTGRTMRVVAIHPGKLSAASAELAPSNIVGADESDAEVDIVLSRLTLEGEWSVR